MIEPQYTYRAVVRSVYDGDTIRVDLDLGLSTWVRNIPLRLYGINAPEMRGTERPQGIIARDWLRKRIPDGCEIIVETFRDQTGKYGRYLAILWDLGSPEGEPSINEAMIEAGMAVPYVP